jgi:hypothetical protein
VRLQHPRRLARQAEVLRDETGEIVQLSLFVS